MMTKDTEKKRHQMQMISLNDIVPQDHLLRDIERAIDFSFIYDLVESKYCHDNGRPSVDPVQLIKIVIIQYLYGIPSMRQTIREIEVNMAYRWFLGLDFTDPVPHFTTFGKNYTRRFKDTDLFHQIFKHILSECIKMDFVDPSVLFIDATHVKAHANKNKRKKELVEKEALFYEEKLAEEIDEERRKRGKKQLKRNNKQAKMKSVTKSTTDPEAGMFHKGEHKREFAYSIQTACDQHGWIIDYTVHPGNEHDSRSFIDLYRKLDKHNPTVLVMDGGYKTPAIAKEIIDDERIPIFPYKRPMTKKGFFKKYEYTYDEYYDCYICPNGKVLRYATTDRDGYQNYKSNGAQCAFCPDLDCCTHSASHQKVITRHVWEPYLEKCEDIRHTRGSKEIYDMRKKTIERIFGTMKEFQGLRYTRLIGKALMNMKAGLTYACANLKKLAIRKRRMGLLEI